MPVAVRQAVRNPMAVLTLNGKVRKKPGNCSSKLKAGEGTIRVSANASRVVEVMSPMRFESGRYLS